MRRMTQILGMFVDLIDVESAAECVLTWSRGSAAKLVVTPNTDHFLRWQSDKSFRELYSRADLVTADGIALPILARLSGVRVPRRVTGVDLFYETVKLASEYHIPLVLIGGGPDVANRAARRLTALYPNLLIPLVRNPTAMEVSDPAYVAQLAEDLALIPEKIVALCLGSPKQERLFTAIESCGGLSGTFLCVGATIDFAAGSVPRAPALVRRVGLEWLYRLFKEPRRLWRRYLIDDVKIWKYLFIALNHRLSVKSDSLGIDEKRT